MPVCTTCGEESPEGFSFCGRCGARLVDAAAAREERKLVTVLYADIVGSTARAETLDPEDVRAFLAPYHARLRRELERFGGTVEKFIGDAVVAVFGAPAAHEDDPERAVRAALAELNDADPELQLEVRPSNHARLLFLRGEGDRGVALATEALAVADAVGDLRVRSEALITLGSARFATGEIEAGLETLERGVELAREHHPVAGLRGLNNLGSFFASLGRLDDARATRSEALAGSERLGIPYFVRWMRVELAFHDYWSGNWAQALDTAAAILAQAEAGESHYMDVGAHWTHSAVALARGNLELARQEADWCLAFGRDSGDPQNVLPLLGWHGRVLAETGDAAAAVAEAEEVLAARSRDAIEFWAPSVAAALDLASRGEVFLAAAPPVGPLRTWWDAGAALAAGRHREAAERFHAIGSLPDEAWARLRAGRALLAESARAEAAAEVERALAFWRSVGAARYVRDAEQLLGEGMRARR